MYNIIYSFQAPWILSSRPPSGWPNEGVIQFVNYKVRYRPDLGFALQDISFQTSREEKVKCMKFFIFSDCLLEKGKGKQFFLISPPQTSVRQCKDVKKDPFHELLRMNQALDLH